MVSSKSTCAACKLQRKKCAPGCIFAPYFSSDNPNKFKSIHDVYGLSNTEKILKKLSPESREAAANSLVFEANCRIRDKVYGCSGYIHFLTEHLEKLESLLEEEKAKLANYMAQTKTVDDYNVQTNVVEKYMPSQSLTHTHYSNGEPQHALMTSMQGTFIVSKPREQHIYNPQGLIINQQPQYPQAMEQQSQLLHEEQGISLSEDKRSQVDDYVRSIEDIMNNDDNDLIMLHEEQCGLLSEDKRSQIDEYMRSFEDIMKDDDNDLIMLDRAYLTQQPQYPQAMEEQSQLLHEEQGISLSEDKRSQLDDYIKSIEDIMKNDDDDLIMFDPACLTCMDL